ncbi:MAG: hypothetical protein M0011_15265 [Elusimicrobia bacterium]|nr:hypothetical protein [Elusimicrobiota bacterium]
MIAGGLIVMALMMGVMFLGGHHMGKKHSSHERPPAVQVSSAPAGPAAADRVPARSVSADTVPGAVTTSTAAVQAAEPPQEAAPPEHAH